MDPGGRDVDRHLDRALTPQGVGVTVGPVAIPRRAKPLELVPVDDPTRGVAQLQPVEIHVPVGAGALSPVVVGVGQPHRGAPGRQRSVQRQRLLLRSGAGLDVERGAELRNGRYIRVDVGEEPSLRVR